jgi:hypothetical protein
MSEVTEEIFGLFLLLQMIENENIKVDVLKLNHEWPNLHNETTFINYKNQIHYFPLDKIVDNRFTDKNTSHSYLETYEKILKDKYLTCKNVLEIGIQHGGSMKLWNDYFVNATIYGIDVDNSPDFLKEFKRVNCLKMNAYSQESIDYFLNKNIAFDFIIDDGPHTFESMVYFIQNYIQLLCVDGILIVEDIQDINWCDTFKKYVPNGFTYEIFDLRHIKNRWDDIVFIVKNNNSKKENKLCFDIGANNFKIEYGIDSAKTNVTDIVLKKLDNHGIFYIPEGDNNRVEFFGDPLYGTLKQIFITNENNRYTIQDNSFAYIDTQSNKLYINQYIPIKNHHHLSIMAIFKNETMNLKMWLEHYLWQGVEHFYLIDNDSTDNPLHILQEYIDKGIVTYYFRPEKHQQAQHYRYVFDKENLKEKTKWLCICDLDEFFFGTEKKLLDALDEFDEYNVIYTNSYFYGSDNLIEHPKDIRTSILHREEDIVNGIKYIFKPSSINNSSEIWIHWLVNSGTLQKKHMNEITQNDKIRLNHYRIQSFEYYKNVKMTRGDADVKQNENMRDLKYFEHYTEIATIKDDILKQIVENGYDSLQLNNSNNINTAVIVEPRFLKHLPFVINDFYKKLGLKWKIVFYCGKGLKNIWLE